MRQSRHYRKMDGKSLRISQNTVFGTLLLGMIIIVINGLSRFTKSKDTPLAKSATGWRLRHQMSEPITRVIHDASVTPIPDDRWVLGWDSTYREWRLVKSKNGNVLRWTLSFLPDGVVSDWMESTAPVTAPSELN